MKSLTFRLSIFICLFFSSSFVSALSVRSLDIRQMVNLSERIFRGTVVDITVDDDQYESGRLVEYTTFKVEECLKGDCDNKVVVKQLPDKQYGVPRYEKGKTYFMFFHGDSAKTGLSSPVGVWQGLFPLEKKNGAWVLPTLKSNPTVSKSLKKDWKALSLPGSADQAIAQGDYESFRAAVKNILEAK